MKLVLQIALGVCLGIMLSIVFSVALWGTVFLKLLPAPSPQVNSVAVKQPEITPPKRVNEELIASETIESKPITQPTVQPESNPPVDSKTAAEIETQQQLLAAQEEKRKKDAAFKKWYQKPEDCLTPNDHGHDVKVACGNHYARAKIAFEELWQQGKLRN